MIMRNESRALPTADADDFAGRGAAGDRNAWYETTGALLVGLYLVALGGLLPLASYLWRNGTSR